MLKKVIALTLALCAASACSNENGTLPTDAGNDLTLDSVSDTASDRSVTETNDVPTSLCNGQSTDLTGTVFAPNGQDPLPGVLAYAITGDPPPIASGVGCDSCQLPTGVIVSDITGTDGRFSLNHAMDAGGAVTVVLQKGRFRRTIRFNAQACTPIQIDATMTALPGVSGTDAVMPKILVASFVFDDIATVLTRMGITEFDRLDGCRGATTMTDIANCPLGQLLADSTRLSQYNIVLLPCGSLGAFHTWQLLPPAVVTGLQEFLRQGGRLYASDLSYGVVQHTIPSAFVWPGGTTPTASGDDPADIGSGAGRPGRSYEGVVADPELRTWLTARGALLTNGNVQLDGFLNPWGAVDSAAATSKIWVHGNVNWRISPTTGDHPLTVQAEYHDANGMGCGRVVFTSYHTTTDATGALTPQERVLEWLLFELGGCVIPG